MRIKHASLIPAALLACWVFGNEAASGEQAQQCPAANITALRSPDGGRVDWRPDGKAIAVDKRNPSTGCYDVYEMSLDGGNEHCLTCGRTDLPKYNKGNPAYYPNSRYIVFQAEKDKHMGKGCAFYTNPGAGLHNDLWGIDTATGKASLLYAVPDGFGTGVLHPHFSHDGRKLLWSEMYHIGGFPAPYKAGKWALKIADVVSGPGGTLALQNVQTLFPTKESGEGFIESHGFTPDNQHVIFSGNLGYTDLLWQHNDIGMADLNGGDKRTLTHEAYNEHGQISPSGRSLALMSSRWTPSKDEQKGTEFYIMNSGGGSACQISHFNTPGYPESQKGITNAADISWSPDGTRFVGYTHDRDFSSLVETIWLVSFSNPQ